MRAMLLGAPKPIEQSPLAMRDVEVPEPGPGEVRVRVRTCGLCHTDLHTVEGDLAPHKRPVVPGHQIVGLVEAVGSNVSRPKEGDRVGIPWLDWTCGECEFCSKDAENLCLKARFTGYDVDGGYAECTKTPADFCYPIPAAFDDAHAAPLLCAGIVGYRAYRLSRFRYPLGAGTGENLGLFGFGASAHLVLQIARFEESNVFVFTRSQEHRALASELGAVWTGRAEDTPPELLHAAIIFAPAGSLVPRALRLLRKGGRLVLGGITMSQLPAFDYDLLYHEKSIQSVANSTRRDAREFLTMAGAFPMKTEVQLFELSRANEALQALKNGEIRGAGVLTIGQG